VSSICLTHTKQAIFLKENKEIFIA